MLNMSSNKLVTLVWNIALPFDAAIAKSPACLKAIIVAGLCSVFKYATFALL